MGDVSHGRKLLVQFLFESALPLEGKIGADLDRPFPIRAAISRACDQYSDESREVSDVNPI
jgi:hypothetical protein